MYVRLVGTSRGAFVQILPLVVMVALCVCLLIGLSDLLRDNDSWRPYLDPEVKRLMIVTSGIVSVGWLIVAVVLIAVGVGALGSIYGWASRGRVVLATPWGMVGYWRQRLRVDNGMVKVYVVSVERPAMRFLRHGPQLIFLSAGRKTIRMSSTVRYDPDTIVRLVQWLAKNGVAAVVEHHSRRNMWDTRPRING